MKIPILLPMGRDAELVARLVCGRESLNAVICPSIQALLTELADEACGLFILGDEVLSGENIERLTGTLDAQPEWSDLPGIILTRPSANNGRLRLLEARREILLVRRPLRKAILTKLIQSAVEVRRRQYQVKTLVADLIRTNKQLRAHTSKLQRLTLEMARVEDRERARIAQILHDDLQPMLASARLQTEMLFDHLTNGPARNARTVHDILSQSMQAARSLSHELNPMSARNALLEESLERLVEQMAGNYGLEIQCDLTPVGDGLSDNIKRFVYRSVQELLFNCAKHAQAGHVHLQMAVRDGRLTITLSDNGVGFNPETLYVRGGGKGGIGLFSIYERAQALEGVFDIRSAPGQGSCFVLSMPCELSGEDD